MPVYQYRDTQSGGIIELCKPVNERDSVPAHLQRITVPVRLAVRGTSSAPKDPTSADTQVPNALKQLTNNQVNDMVKESGMSVDTYRRTWGL